MVPAVTVSKPSASGNFGVGYCGADGTKAGIDAGMRGAGPHRAPVPRRGEGPQGQAYVSNSATLGVPPALLIWNVTFLSEVFGKVTVPAPLPEASTAPVS